MLNYLRKNERRNIGLEKKWKLDAETPTNEIREPVEKRRIKM